MCGRGDGEWECEDTRGVQVGVKNKERMRLYGEKVNNEEDIEVNRLMDGE